MAKLLLKSEIEPKSTGKPERSLCYEGGDVIFKLSGNPREHLLLHSSVLKEASTFFLPGTGSLKEQWDEKYSKVITHPNTGVATRVYTYHLTYSTQDSVFVLNSTRDRAYSRPHSACYFYLSNNATSFLSRENTGWTDRGTFEDSRLEHVAMFSIIYDAAFDLGSLTYTNIANIIAYSELYGLFDLVAATLRDHYEQIPDIGNDIRDNFQFHLSVSKKLRSADIYNDAMRHFIGSGVGFARLKDLDYQIDELFELTSKREELQVDIEKLTNKLQSLTLATYTPHANRSEQGTMVKTTYLASSYPSDRGFHVQTQDIARRIFMEWLNHQLCAIRASQLGKELELFDPNAPAEFVKNTSVVEQDKPYMTKFVEDELKKTVREAGVLAQPMVAPADFKPVKTCSADAANGPWGQGGAKAREYGTGASSRRRERERSHFGGDSGFERVAMTAKVDSNCHYFTCVEMSDDDLPWDGDWESYSIEGLQPASTEWLQTLGLEDDYEEYSEN